MQLLEKSKEEKEFWQKESDDEPQVINASTDRLIQYHPGTKNERKEILSCKPEQDW